MEIAEGLLLLVIGFVAYILLIEAAKLRGALHALDALNVDHLELLALEEDGDHEGIEDLYYRRYTQEEKLLWMRLARHLSLDLSKRRVWKWNVKLYIFPTIKKEFPFLFFVIGGATLNAEFTRIVDGGWCNVNDKLECDVWQNNPKALAALRELHDLRAAYHILRPNLEGPA